MDLMRTSRKKSCLFHRCKVFNHSGILNLRCTLGCLSHGLLRYSPAPVPSAPPHPPPKCAHTNPHIKPDPTPIEYSLRHILSIYLSLCKQKHARKQLLFRRANRATAKWKPNANERFYLSASLPCTRYCRSDRCSHWRRTLSFCTRWVLCWPVAGSFCFFLFHFQFRFLLRPKDIDSTRNLEIK